MKRINVRWRLVAYDILIYVVSVGVALLLFINTPGSFTIDGLVNASVLLVGMFVFRALCRTYQQIWRYGGTQGYIRLVIADTLSAAVGYALLLVLPVKAAPLHVVFAVYSTNLIGSLLLRMVYRYIYKSADTVSKKGIFFSSMLRIFAGFSIHERKNVTAGKIKIAIIGAGRVGVSLAEELLNNRLSKYSAGCFVDINKTKIDRMIHGIPVIPDDEYTLLRLEEYDIGEIVVAIPELEESQKKKMYDFYSAAGYKIKVYDYPMMQSAGSRRYMREFDIEELLFRKPVIFRDENTEEYYRNKVVLITGGGGSIGSELCRQLAKMDTKKIIILDIYENGAYDIQQELKIAYREKLDLSIEIEIASITNKRAMDRVFEEYKPDIVINAAAHKHVPLMEHNCVEAVENNVFGTKNLVELCEKHGVERFMMVSTDKAVNPTNVMGATKRMCEMIVQSASLTGKVKYSATRFGNVLGSAGSVIPLFKRQISNGGPITLTDKRIIRYFMTIPEASQLVLQSGAMAKNGELFVLDMGKPIKIFDLAESMIRLSGVKDIDIIETGLRPGEKLYEELLVKTDELEKTANKLIFVERETPLSNAEIAEKLKLLKEACLTGDDDAVRAALKTVVPTYKTMDEINQDAENSREMNEAREAATV